jgi:hypothetical protein
LKIGCAKSGSVGSTLKYCSSDELNAIQAYREQFVTLMNSKVKSKERSVWALSCAKHCYLSGESYTSQAQKIPQITGLDA